MFICFPASICIPVPYLAILKRIQLQIQTPMNTYDYSSNRYNIAEFKPKEKDQPKDTVSALLWDRFNLNEHILFAASWDGFVRAYAIPNNGTSELAKVQEFFLQHPVICIDVNPNGLLFAGLASGDVVAVNIPNGQKAVVGNHDAPICGIFWIEEKGALMTLGFDNLIKFWDIGGQNSQPMIIDLPLKTVTCSFDFPLLLIGSVQTTILIFNLKNLPNISKPTINDYLKCSIQRFSKFMSSSIIAANKSAVLGTIDGRAYCFDIKQGYHGKFEMTNQYIARVQKQIIRSTTFYGQVNSLDLGYYNHQHYLVISGPEDTSIFNVCKKTKAKTLSQNGVSVGAGTAVKIHPKQEYLAYSNGCDWTKGLYELETIKRPRIVVTKLLNNDLVSFVDNK